MLASFATIDKKNNNNDKNTKTKEKKNVDAVTGLLLLVLFGRLSFYSPCMYYRLLTYECNLKTFPSRSLELPLVLIIFTQI